MAGITQSKQKCLIFIEAPSKKASDQIRKSIQNNSNTITNNSNNINNINNTKDVKKILKNLTYPFLSDSMTQGYV